MQKLIEAAWRQQTRGSASDTKAEFHILPQQSEDELVLSMFHSKLDRVLQFLTREIGYALLDDARPSRGGGVALQRKPHPAGGARGRRSGRIPKGDPHAGEEEVREVIRISADSAKYAHYPDDIVLVWRFTRILVDATSDREVASEEALVSNNEEIHRTVLQGIRLMHLCSYDYSDLVVTLAYASVYFKSTCKAIGHKMSDTEAAHVCVLLIFLAHSFVIDETCPLRYWQKFVFRKYCTLKVLDEALFRIFEMRDFRLRISEEDERHALSILLCSSGGFDVILSGQEGPSGSDSYCHRGAASEAETCSTTATSSHRGVSSETEPCTTCSREHRDEAPKEDAIDGDDTCAALQCVGEVPQHGFCCCADEPQAIQDVRNGHAPQVAA